MFLLPSIGVGFLFALLLGGKPSRVLDVELRAPWTVALALGIQIVLFSRISPVAPGDAKDVLHVATYGLLLFFAVVNRRQLALLPVMLGMALNAIAITANHGSMPVTRAAATAAGLAPAAFQNVSEHAHRLVFLGDVFALPRILPLSNTFSIGDLLISFGMVVFVVVVSTRDTATRSFTFATTFKPLQFAGYRHLVLGKLISSVGDWLTVATVIGWIYSDTHSTAAVAVTLIARLAPPILGGGVAAYVVDRLPKDRLLVSIEVARGAVATVALVGIVEGRVAIVLAALAASGALAAISGATTRSLTPSLVPVEQLPAANAGLGLVSNAAMALGASGAGLALAASTAPAALLLDIATFAIAAALFSRLRVAAPSTGSRRSSGTHGAWRYVASRRRILLLIGSFGVATFATGLTNTILPRFLAGNAGLGPGGYGFGIAALAAGLAVGETVVGFTPVGATAGRWIGVGLLMTGGILCTLATSHHAASIFLFLGLVGFIDGSTDILFDLVIQREASPEYYGATFGVSSALTSTTMVGGFALAAPLGALVSPGGVVAISGAAFGFAGVIALTAIVRRQATAPKPAIAPAG
ncbi:MAG TPA: MFS transporter [Gaiellaceae bacterium]